ncbi:MAG: hypothetical protein HQ581_27665 [Planctomycetes bacterium]|nr:hypothetical protein [Planctomycetota bacterium]
MSLPSALPEQWKIVDATAGCVTSNGGFTSDYVSLKNAQMAYIVLQFTQAVGHATVIQPQVATAVAPTGAASITFSAEWWENEDTATSDTLVAQTAATSMTVTDDAKKKQVIIKIDPSQCAAQGATYDVIGFTVSNSGQATNFVAGQFYLLPRYPQATPLAAITD